MKSTRWIVPLLSVAALAGGAAWWWQQRDAGAAVSYRTGKIERGLLQATVSASGMVNPVQQVQISSQVSGQIRELLVDFNSEVKQGQLIAKLDQESFQYRLRQASADVDAARASVLTAQATVQNALAQLARAQVELQEGRRDLERKQGLVAQNFISPAELETARARVATLDASLKAGQAQVEMSRAQARNAEAVVKQREAQLSQARVDLERTEIRSPVDGIVIKRSVEVGQTVAASLQAPELFVIARNLSDMQVEASVDEADVARVKLEQKAGFTIDGFPGRTFEGSVRQVRKAATSAQNVVTYVVVVAFANPGSALLPGMTANVRIVTDVRDDVLKLPNAALRVRLPGVEPEMPSRAAQSSLVRDAYAAGAATAASAPGGPMAELRERLVRDLALSPEQQQKVDAILAAQRPRFGELRTLPEEDRARVRERILGDIRALVAEQLTPEQRARYQSLAVESSGRQLTRGRIYLLGDDGKPKALNVRLGITDGVSTELLVASGAADAAVLREGATVITGVVGGAAQATPRQAGPRPTF